MQASPASPMPQSVMDHHSRNLVTGWLLVMAALVAAMVVIGGITRLTGSGLSMTEWRPLMGTLPPMNADEWERVFALYKASPEYHAVNYGMDLAGFKTIFFWEYFISLKIFLHIFELSYGKNN